MPIYEYQCTECHHELEVIQKFSDPIKTVCGQCGKSTLRKKMSLPSFQLKGGGWFSDGYGNKKNDAAPPDKADSNKTDAGKSDSTSTNKDASKSSKTDTKPAKEKTGGTTKPKPTA